MTFQRWNKKKEKKQNKKLSLTSFVMSDLLSSSSCTMSKYPPVQAFLNAVYKEQNRQVFETVKCKLGHVCVCFTLINL